MFFVLDGSIRVDKRFNDEDDDVLSVNLVTR